MFDGMIFRSGRGLRSAAVLAVFAAAAAAGPETSVTKVDVVSLPSKTKEIRLLRSFPMERDEAQGIYFSQPQSLSTDPHGRIYVSDVGERLVWVFGPDGRFLAKMGRSGQGPGELQLPLRALWTKDLIAVLDGGNARVQYFDGIGHDAKAVRLGKVYSDFAVSQDGTLFATTVLKDGPGDLIDAIGPEGKVLFSFGRPPDLLAGGGAPLLNWLSMSPADELFVAYWFSPVVQVYSAGGELRSVYEIRYKPMQDKVARNKTQPKTAAGGGRVVGQSIIESIWATDRSFYVLHRGPRIEILEFKRDGTFAKIYWTRQTADYYPRDLAVLEEGGRKTFLLLQAAPEYKVDVFIEK
jgi:hypothetical protein